MAPAAKDRWIRRFIITETKRHKKGFTIYKVTSMIFLKSSHEEVSKVSVWKRYNDFKKLHAELGHLHKRYGTKESFPAFPKSKYFGRFEAEVVDERKRCALKFLEFVGRYSYLYTSDIFVTFFDTSHADSCGNDCAHSLSSDTSEDDRVAALSDAAHVVNDNAVPASACRAPVQVPLKAGSQSALTNSRSTLSGVICANKNELAAHRRKNESHGDIDLPNANVSREEQSYKTAKLHTRGNVAKHHDAHQNKSFDRHDVTALGDVSGFDSLNNNVSKPLSNYDIPHPNAYPAILREEVNVRQARPDITQYLLIAAAHISAAFKHESIAEYEEAFTQYKLGISCLINGVQFDPDGTRVPGIKDKISKYLARAEQLYNEHLNCNVSKVSKPVSELQHYKVLKIMKSVMLVTDMRANCNRIIKTVEKSCIYEDSISNYVLHKQVPYMVHLYACIETETSVFLVLQYASCGRLWDFVDLHYGVSDIPCNVIPNRTCTNGDINGEVNCNENLRGPNKADRIMENKLRGNSQSATDVRSEIHMEMPTTQLLEKSQELLQSVNATLRRSNSIVNRLNEYKELRHSDGVPSPNAKTVTQISEGSDLVLSNAYRNKSLDSKKIVGIVVENSSTKGLKNKDLKVSDSSLTNNNENVSRNICAATLNGSCMARDSLKNNKVDNLSCNNSTSKTSMRNASTNNIVHICENNNTESISNQINSNVNCNIDETQYLYQENNIEYIDEEQTFWQVPESVIRSWAAEILLALEALHQQNILILDFKPDNILLDDAGHIRLTYIIPQHNVELSKLTYPYSSPELVTFSPTVLVTSATDVWSFGVILYELLTGTMFIRNHPGSFHSHSAINIPSRLSESARSLLYGILKYYPEERLTVDEIKRHPFFAGIDWLINSQTY